MNDMTPARGIGDNRPPETIADELAVKYAADIAVLNDAIGAAERAPGKIDDNDDETAGGVIELVKKMRTVELKIEKYKDLELEQPKKVVEQIRGFFTKTVERSEVLRKKLNAVHKDYADRKAAAEKKRLEEEEAKRREEAEAARRRQQAAADTKRDAQFAFDEMNRLARDATEARASAQTGQELANAVLAEAKAALSKVKAEVASKAAEYANRELDGTAVSAEEKASAKADLEARLAASRKAVSDAEDELRAARQRALAAKEEERRRDEEARAAARQVTAAIRDEKGHADEATRHERVADKIAAKVDGPEADLARTRSIHGAVGTLTRRWTATVVDRAALDKEALWPFIQGDAISAALWKWMQTQPPEHRKMTGALMQEETEGQVR